MLDEEYHVDFSFDPVAMSMMWPGPIGAKPVVTFLDFRAVLGLRIVLSLTGRGHLIKIKMKVV